MCPGGKRRLICESLLQRRDRRRTRSFAGSDDRAARERIPSCGILAAVAIRSFASERIREFFESGGVPRRIGWSAVAAVVRRKLDMIEYAAELRDLRSPRGNRLEALRGERKGFHSIRVNDQWRVIFRWSERGAEDVDVVDYR